MSDIFIAQYFRKDISTSTHFLRKNINTNCIDVAAHTLPNIALLTHDRVFVPSYKLTRL